MDCMIVNKNYVTVRQLLNGEIMDFVEILCYSLSQNLVTQDSHVTQ